MSFRQTGQMDGPKLTENDRVGREDGKLGVELVEVVKFVGRAADRVGEEESIPLGPADLSPGILETNTRAGHCDCCSVLGLFGELEAGVKGVWMYGAALDQLNEMGSRDFRFQCQCLIYSSSSVTRLSPQHDLRLNNAGSNRRRCRLPRSKNWERSGETLVSVDHRGCPWPSLPSLACGFPLSSLTFSRNRIIYDMAGYSFDG